MFNIVLLASGNGSNVQAIIDAVERGKCPVHICAVVSDKADAFVLTRAAEAGIQTFTLTPSPKEPNAAFNERLANLLRALSCDLIVLAGYMRILSPGLVRAFDGKIINIHPSLLPQYKGLDTHARVLAGKECVHGATVHFVSEGVDEGPIIAQTEVPVKSYDTAETLHKRVLAREHKLYPLVLSWFASHKIQLKDGRVYIGDVLCDTTGMKVGFTP